LRRRQGFAMQLAHVRAEPRAPARSRSLLSSEAIAGYLCVLPALAIILTFSVAPVVFSLGLSLFRWNLASPTITYVGLRNFETLFASETFWQVLQNTVVFSAGSVALNVVLAFNLALLLDTRLRGVAFFRALLFVPHLVPMVVIATLWLFMFDPVRGPVNALLGLFGLPGPAWLQSTSWAMPAMIVVKVWKSVGYYTILFLAALQTIPQELYDAARVDGAGFVRRTHHLTLPLISPMTLFVVIVAVIGSFQDFDQIVVMTRGGPVDSTNVLVYFLYEQAFRNHQIGLGSAVAVVMLGVLVIFTAIKLRLARLWVHY
jgi:ABC-type sugar transport system permease subunit